MIVFAKHTKKSIFGHKWESRYLVDSSGIIEECTRCGAVRSALMFEDFIEHED